MSYNLINEKYFDFYNINFKYYSHKNGVKIIFLLNNDNQFAFTTLIKTIPENNKGIPHILEHLILNGSKNYIVKDTFNELLKNSIQDYLNAITYNDKTLYPISSTNEEEFLKIIDVYLDGIYNPLLREGGFMQEGVYFKKKNNEITPNGIVYNEMLAFDKNVFLQGKHFNYETLLKNHYQKYNSGGIPEDILNVKYLDVLNYYKENYVNENTYIFLYGNLDEEKYLSYINQKYLLNKNVVHKKTNLPSFEEKEVKKNISKENKFKDIIIGSFIIGKSTNVEVLLLTEIIYIYLKNNLKYYNVELDKDNYFIIINIYLEKVNLERKEFMENLFDVIKNLKINLSEINNIINKKLFEIMEEDYNYKTRGLGLIFLLLNNVMYDEEILKPLELNNILIQIKSKISKAFIKDFLLRKFILNKNTFINTYSFLKKDKGIIYQNESDMKILEEFQNIKDNPKDLLKFKKVNYENILKKDEINLLETEYVEGIEFNKFKIENENLFYIKIHFNIDKIDDEKLYLVGIINWMFNNLNKIDDSYIMKELFLKFQGTSCECNSFLNNETNVSKEILTITLKGYKENILYLNNIIKTILYDKTLQSFNVSSYIINRIKEDLKVKINQSEYSFVENRCKSKTYREFNRLGKIEFYDFYKQILNIKDFDNSFQENINHVYDKIFMLDNISISICSNEANCNKIIQSIRKTLVTPITSIKKENTFRGYENSFTDEIINHNTNNFSNGMILLTDIKNIEALLLISYIIENTVLFEKIRLKGGAYGYGCNVVNNMDLFFYSFKDPNILKTKEVFIESLLDIKKVICNDKKFNEFKIGTINKLIKFKHPYKKFNELLQNKFEGKEIDYIKLLSITKKEILILIDVIESKKNNYSFVSM